MESLKEILLVLGRIVTILPLLLLIAIYMGKRAIGQLPVFDFLIIVTLGSVVGADIADPNVHHLPTAVAIVAIGFLQRIVANWKISNRTIGRLLTFEPTIVIQHGKFLNKNLKKIRYSIDNILQMLREKDVFDIKEVETAIVEANGSISVLKIPQKNTVTLEDMKINRSTSSIAVPVIIEGTVYPDILEDFNLDQQWLLEHLAIQGVHNLKDVFFASINGNHELHISLINEESIKVPTINH
ncbi:hypothetical protein BHU72_13405 [Desulfuribacillus stibiiarsenatis]|uniref:YetF C-terminal domain-containing protein n=1 Tax=Desulfuribacillus stibiiarsenatis TaxID=1390249 RepID=A0A1E5L8J7_9FIRM|nr:hypothetical protein BHU72_13405 [Desulfuribacillus stibiiarsenatis]